MTTVTKDLTRRRALSGAATVGAGLPLLAACGGDGSDSGSNGSAPTPESGQALGPTSEVPVGGGTIFKDQEIVVTQPAQGQYKGFSAICTHQGCLLANVEGGTINCDCHGSKFSIEDGSVENGPATSPLESVSVKVQNGDIVTA